MACRERKKDRYIHTHSECELEEAARRFSARCAPLCSEVKRTVRARLSSSLRLVYSSPVKDDSAVLQPSVSTDSHRISSLRYLPPFSSHRFILMVPYLLRLIIKSSANIVRLVALFVDIFIDCALHPHTHVSDPSYVTTRLRRPFAFAIYGREAILAPTSVALFRAVSTFHSSSSILILSFSPSNLLARDSIYESGRYDGGKLHGYLPPETYNGRFTALVNKCFPLNNIREKRDGAMLAVHYTPAQLSRRVRRETARKERSGLTFLVGLHFCGEHTDRRRKYGWLGTQWCHYD